MTRPYKNTSQHSELLNFGKTVRPIRLDAGISQEALAGLANIDRSYMGDIKRGE
jgi:transcriptional regulator with XRE-family HTH domain